MALGRDWRLEVPREAWRSTAVTHAERAAHLVLPSHGLLRALLGFLEKSREALRERGGSRSGDPKNGDFAFGFPFSTSQDLSKPGGKTKARERSGA